MRTKKMNLVKNIQESAKERNEEQLPIEIAAYRLLNDSDYKGLLEYLFQKPHIPGPTFMFPPILPLTPQAALGYKLGEQSFEKALHDLSEKSGQEK